MEKNAMGEQQLNELYALTIAHSYDIRLAVDMYNHRVLDLNQFITRIAELTNHFTEEYLKLTENGKINYDFAASIARQNHETRETT